ncbi:MAG: hypothetical protein RLZZ303_420 [Candidatus Hydrogenedentota bacterium]|jgi:hypothetical protein
MTTTEPQAASPNPGSVFPFFNQAILIVGLTIVALLAITAIRMLALEVTRYQVDVYEEYTRAALQREAYAEAIELTTGAIRSGVNRSDHHGRALLLRALAHLRMDKLDPALEDLLASGAFFQERYYFAEEQDHAELTTAGTELAQAFLDAGNARAAHQAFGIAAVASSRPVEYITRLRDSLGEQERALLWPDGKPVLTLRDAGAVASDKYVTVVESQGRQVSAMGIEGSSEINSLQLELVAPQASGRSVYAVPVWMPLTQEGFTLRFVARAEGGPLPTAFVGFWFDSARESAHALGSGWVDAGEGWQACTLSSNFIEQLREQGRNRGFSIHDGIINQAGFEFSPDSATKVWLDRVEITLAE